MWKKEDEQSTQPRVESPSRTPDPKAATQGPARATIGPSITIRGDVTGSEDLLIQGQVDGSVTLENHTVGVGSEGRVKADIVGRVITIEGNVEGDLTAQEQIVLRGSAQVKGDIKAPRVVLEDGATFRGLVDMGSPGGKEKEKEKAASESGRASAKGADAGKGNGKPAADDAEKGGSGTSSSAKSSSSTSSGSGKSQSSDAAKQQARA